MLSFPSTSIFAAIFGSLAFSQFPAWTDLAVALLLYFGMWTLAGQVVSVVSSSVVGMFPRSIDAFAGPPRTPNSRLLRSYLKSVLSKPESRKIFYFLMLNMCYMLVQMLYGVWTNSLGLISDGVFFTTQYSLGLILS